MASFYLYLNRHELIQQQQQKKTIKLKMKTI